MSDYADFVPWDWNVEIPGLTTRDAVRLLLDSRSLGLSEWLGYASSHTHVRWVMNAGGGFPPPGVRGRSVRATGPIAHDAAECDRPGRVGRVLVEPA